jgi:hypothetical protein
MNFLRHSTNVNANLPRQDDTHTGSADLLAPGLTSSSNCSMIQELTIDPIAATDVGLRQLDLRIQTGYGGTFALWAHSSIVAAMTCLFWPGVDPGPDSTIFLVRVLARASQG